MTAILFAGSAPLAQGRAATPWPDGARGAVSVTYDDSLDSQLDVAIPALNAVGLKATFFVTMDNARHRLAEWAMLVGQGHEIADHTMTHPCDLQRYLPRRFIKQQVDPMEAWLSSIDPGRHDRTFAYPCDVTNLGSGSPNDQAHRYARLLQRAGNVAARTSEGETNNPLRLRQQAYRLQALAVGYDATDVETVMEYLALAEQRGHWAILVFHEIGLSVGNAGTVSSAMHASTLDGIRSLGLWAAPMRDVLSRLA